MKEIKLSITTLSPLAVGRKKPGSVSEAEDYIRGSVIRGAIADYLIRQLGQPEDGDDFHQLFLSDDAAIFRNAYPAENILPATAVSSKANSGFKSDQSKNNSKFKPKKNGVFDTLIDRFCAEAYDYPYDPSCPEDKGRVEPFGGFYKIIKYLEINEEPCVKKCKIPQFLLSPVSYILSPTLTVNFIFVHLLKDRHYETVSVSKRLLTRAGINRRRATSEEEILYSIEVLNEVQGQKKEPVEYQSSILIKDNHLAESLTNLINQNPEQIRLGGSISRGLGKVRIEAKLCEPQNEVEFRIKEFKNSLETRMEEWGKIFQTDQTSWKSDRIYFTINLQADAILIDHWRRTTVISEAMLRDFTEIEDDSLKLHIAYSSYDYRSGWNAAWGLNKDLELVTNKGGVYLFSVSKENYHKLWLKALQELELKGVGERTLEGFGQIKICDPFHLIFWEEAK